METTPRATPESRAHSFAQFADSKSGSKFLVEGIHASRNSTTGVFIKRRDKREFPIAQVSGIVDALDDQARELGGQRLDEFTPFSNVTQKDTWVSVYEFSAQKLERAGSLK